jgi:mono/diheme cytochrome c family protein
MSRRTMGRLWAVAAAAAIFGCGEDDANRSLPDPDAFPHDPVECAPDVAFGGASAAPTVPIGFAGSGNEISPQFQAANVTAEKAPPPISGGTMLTSADQSVVIAADPDRDSIYVIDAATRTLRRRIELQPGDEPGRVVQDKSGRVHVALRSGHAIASFGLDADAPVQRTDVCDLPRGMAYDSNADRLYVACAEGRLVEVDPIAAKATRKIELGRDLRDVILRGSSVLVTRFRSAELLDVNLADGRVMTSYKPRVAAQHEQTVVDDGPELRDPRGCHLPAQHIEDRTNMLESEVAWRTIDMPGVGIAMLHQRAGSAEVRVQPGGYGGGSGCSPGIVHPSLSVGDQVSGSVELFGGGLLVDLAADPTGAMLAVANPGGWGTSSGVMLYPTPDAASVSAFPEVACQPPIANVMVPGQVTAVSFVNGWMLAIQEREPAAVTFYDVRTKSIVVRLDLQQPSRNDSGHALFHLTTGSGIACASCHAEAGDDGHVWEFHGIGPRRTQNLRGGILGSEPFHWNGDMRDFSMLVKEVFVGRMGGPEPGFGQADTLAHWIDRQPALVATANDVAAVQRGKALFESEAVGCANCHNGARLSNNESVDVGTGALLQVPSLRAVSFRAPVMHTGCAKTLADRFGAQCGGGDQHGHTSQLRDAEIADLVAYLESL